MGGRRLAVLLTMLVAAWATDAAAAGAPLAQAQLSAAIRVEVAQDGRPGSYPTITQALSNAPTTGTPYVVLIRKGTYPEALEVTRPNVRLVGEGMGLTVITANKSKMTGHDTAKSATVDVKESGKGFMAQDLTIENTAGADAGQAVALVSSSHKSVCYRCELRGFQDTLWAAMGDQFYRDCIITGTVDFIFGQARALFQGCTILARRRPGGQQDVITAQGRERPDHRSGFVFQNCTVTAAQRDPAAAGSTFLGRPWRDHSLVVFVDSFLDAVVNPAGWQPWDETSKVPDTVYYGEFHNTGPGADTRGRVAFHLLGAKDAANFTVSAFLIRGGRWIRRFHVPYY